MNNVHLTPRELEAVRYLASGLRYDAVAHEMKCSPRTVRFHVEAARQKLHAHTVAQLIRHATDAGVDLTLPPKAEEVGGAMTTEGALQSGGEMDERDVDPFFAGMTT